MRLIAMGGDALAEGFALLGFETYANPRPEEVEQLVSGLLRTGDEALVFLEDRVAPRNSRALLRARREGGRIVITQVPAVQSPKTYRPAIEDLVTRTLGSSALEDKA